MPTAHRGDCLARRDWKNIKWFRFGKHACCLICLKLFRTSQILALHTLTHNLFEIKFLGLHPLVLWRVAEYAFKNGQVHNFAEEEFLDEA
jgi:hypothetical protein